METIYLDDYLSNGILKEKLFLNTINKTNWKNYNNKQVLIKGCSSAPIPTWAYLIIATRLSQFAKNIFYGEPCSMVKIFSKNN